MTSEETRARFLSPTAEPAAESVAVGDMRFTIRAIASPTVLLHVQKEAEARMKASALLGLGDRVPAPEEILFYTWLEHGLVEPKLSFDDILRGSEGFGLDCVAAGIRVAELSGAMPEAVEDSLPFSPTPPPTEDGGADS